MCGITGFVDYSKSSNKFILESMNASMQHRGPDGCGSEIFETNNNIVGLAQNRLSIIDLSDNGKQPMQYKNYTIVFNGEVYNYKEIKKTLLLLKHTFKSSSDTEVILHAYEEWGIRAVDKFIGMFAIAIYNCLKQEIIFIRDRAGVKPFFYYKHQGLFLFASELKAFHKHPLFHKEINTDAVAAYMQYGYVPTPNCIFKNTFKLKPGTIMIYDLVKNNLITQTYWNVSECYNKPKLNLEFEEAKFETEKIISKACHYRMVSDVPVGVFLSGGYDSCLVTALLQKNSLEKLKTFTIGISDKALNEAEHAKAVAQHLGTDHTEYYCTAQEALEIVPSLPFFYDEPFADSSAIPTILVSKIAKKDVKVALSADAGDEIFAGYNRYGYACEYSSKLLKTPKFLKHTVANILNVLPTKIIPKYGKDELFISRYNKLKAVLKYENGEDFLNTIVKIINDKEVEALVKVPPNKLETFFNDFLNNGNLLDSMMVTDYKTYLLDDILQKVDRAGMSVSLESREPLLDQNIIEWAATLPLNYKYNNGIKKHIIKEIVHQYVPKKIMERPKMGFTTPLNSWLKNELKEYVITYTDKNYLESQNIFNPKSVQFLVNSFYKGYNENAEKIWHLLMFQLWYKQWMN